MSKENFFKTLVMLLAIMLAVLGILYARVNLGMSEQAFTAWLDSTTGTLVVLASVVWTVVIGVMLMRVRW